MKYLLCLILLTLAACSPDGSGGREKGGDVSPWPLSQCVSVKDEMGKLNGSSIQEVFLKYSEWLIQHPGCSQTEVTSYLDSVLSIECGNNCLIKERK